jgi:tetratricopeptide (TPR) repeat protein
MKRIYFLLLTVFLFNGLTAQEQTGDNNQCDVTLSLERDYLKSGKYNEALGYWEKVYKKCPTHSEAIFADGTKIFKYKYKKALKSGNKAEVETNYNKLMELYDQWVKNFPKTKYIGKIYQDKGLLMLENKKGTDEELYNIFHEGYSKGKNTFTNPKALYAYFKYAVKMYNNNKLSFEDLINLYDDIQVTINKSVDKYTVMMEKLLKKEEKGELMKSEERKLKGIQKNIPAYTTISKNMDLILGELGDCKHLVPLYKRKFDENKNDASWLRKAAGNLSKKDCSNDPIFAQLVTQLDKIEPSYSSAYYLGILNEKKGRLSTAEKYYKKAISLSDNAYDKAKVYYKLAKISKKKGLKSQARNYAYKALEYKPSMGSAYLLIANLYASSANSCGNDEFSKRATFWLAAQMADKAAKVDPAIAKHARKAAKNYRLKAPSKEMIFMQNMAGKTIPLKCWIGKSVKVPSVK